MKKFTKKFFAIGLQTLIVCSISTIFCNNQNTCQEQYLTRAEHEDYHRVSKSYDKTRIPVGTRIILNELSSLSVPVKQQVILDGGCGSGNYLVALHDSVGFIHGVDINTSMLEKAKNKVKNANNIIFKTGSILALPYENNMFDGMIVNQVLHHLETVETVEKYSNLRVLVREAYRVLKPGGLFILNVSSHEQWIDGFWFYALIPQARDKFLKKHISLPGLQNMLLDEKFMIKTMVTPVDEVLQSSSYFDPLGPLDKTFREGDSTWALATPEELEHALAFVREMQKNGTLEQYFIDRERKRMLVGQTTFLVAQKPQVF